MSPAVLVLLKLVWFWVSGTMAVFGVLLVWTWRRMTRGDRSLFFIPWLIGTFYLIEGVYGTWFLGAFFSLFILLAVILFVSSLTLLRHPAGS